MRFVARWIAALCVLTAAASPALGQRRRSSAEIAVVRALVQELKGLTPAKQRTADQLRADCDKALTYLLDLLAASPGSSRQRYYLADLEAICLRAGRPGAEGDRKAVCNVLLARLASETDKSRRLLLTDMLQHVGAGESVAVLGRLLADRDGEIRQAALRALQANPSKAAADEIRKSLFSAVTDPWRVSTINALGYRRDRLSVEALGKLLARGRSESASVAAADALAKIGGPEATAALEAVRADAPPPVWRAVSDGLLTCADRILASGNKAAALRIYQRTYENSTKPRPVRVAAFQSLVSLMGEQAVPLVMKVMAGGDAVMAPVAMSAARTIPGEAATRALAALLNDPRLKAAAERTKGGWLAKQIELIELLGERSDPSARKTVLALIATERDRQRTPHELCMAAIKAMAGVGTAADVPLLAVLSRPVKSTERRKEVLEKEAEQKQARWALERLEGEGVDGAILSLLAEADLTTRRELIGLLGRRGATGATAALLKFSDNPDAATRYATLAALASLADETALPALVKWLASAKDTSERYAAERAVRYVCRRTKDKAAAAATVVAAVEGADVPQRCSLLTVCGHLGGPKAREALLAGAAETNETVRTAAIKAMSYSTDPAIAAELLKLARTAPSKEARKLAVQGYLRQMRYAAQPPEKKLWTYLQILDIAEGAEEKRLALSGLGDIKTLGAMKLALERIYTPELTDTAAYTVCRIARYLYSSHTKEVAEAMAVIRKLTRNEKVLREVARVEERLKRAKTKP